MSLLRVSWLASMAMFTLLGADSPTSPAPTADEIMRRVAANQDELQSGRNLFVYDQKIKVVSRRGNGKVVCRQDSEYVVTPKEKTSEHKLVSTHGEFWRKDHFVDFDHDLNDDERTMDAGIVKSIRDEFTQTDSKDGIEGNLFPLTTEEQKDLQFELAGTRTVEGRLAYLINFRPKDKHDFGWAGEATIDAEEFQPFTVYTKLSRKLPFAVRTLLGTDVPGLGFTTRYTRVAKDIWFPSSFGTEFRIDAVYFFHRTLTVDLQNRDFRRTSTDSDIRYEQAQTQ
jgi:hypothetical protein